MIFQLNVLMVYSVFSHLPHDTHVKYFSNSIQIRILNTFEKNTRTKYLKHFHKVSVFKIKYVFFSVYISPIFYLTIYNLINFKTGRALLF